MKGTEKTFAVASCNLVRNFAEMCDNSPVIMEVVDKGNAISIIADNKNILHFTASNEGAAEITAEKFNEFKSFLGIDAPAPVVPAAPAVVTTELQRAIGEENYQKLQAVIDATPYKFAADFWRANEHFLKIMNTKKAPSGRSFGLCKWCSNDSINGKISFSLADDRENNFSVLIHEGAHSIDCQYKKSNFIFETPMFDGKTNNGNDIRLIDCIRTDGALLEYAFAVADNSVLDAYIKLAEKNNSPAFSDQTKSTLDKISILANKLFPRPEYILTFASAKKYWGVNYMPDQTLRKTRHGYDLVKMAIQYHNRTLNKKQKEQPHEFFAEMLEYAIMDPNHYADLKILFPKTTAAFEYLLATHTPNAKIPALPDLSEKIASNYTDETNAIITFANKKLKLLEQELVDDKKAKLQAANDATPVDAPAPATENTPAPATDDNPAPAIDDNPAPAVPTAPVVDEKPAPAIDDNPAPAIDDNPAPAVPTAPVVDDNPAPAEITAANFAYRFEFQKKGMQRGSYIANIKDKHFCLAINYRASLKKIFEIIERCKNFYGTINGLVALNTEFYYHNAVGKMPDGINWFQHYWLENAGNFRWFKDNPENEVYPFKVYSKEHRGYLIGFYSADDWVATSPNSGYIQILPTLPKVGTPAPVVDVTEKENDAPAPATENTPAPATDDNPAPADSLDNQVGSFKISTAGIINLLINAKMTTKKAEEDFHGKSFSDYSYFSLNIQQQKITGYTACGSMVPKVSTGITSEGLTDFDFALNKVIVPTLLEVVTDTIKGNPTIDTFEFSFKGPKYTVKTPSGEKIFDATASKAFLLRFKILPALDKFLAPPVTAKATVNIKELLKALKELNPVYSRNAYDTVHFVFDSTGLKLYTDYLDWDPSTPLIEKQAYVPCIYESDLKVAAGSFNAADIVNFITYSKKYLLHSAVTFSFIDYENRFKPRYINGPCNLNPFTLETSYSTGKNIKGQSDKNTALMLTTPIRTAEAEDCFESILKKVSGNNNAPAPAIENTPAPAIENTPAPAVDGTEKESDAPASQTETTNNMTNNNSTATAVNPADVVTFSFATNGESTTPMFAFGTEKPVDRKAAYKKLLAKKINLETSYKILINAIINGSENINLAKTGDLNLFWSDNLPNTYQVIISQYWLLRNLNIVTNSVVKNQEISKAFKGALFNLSKAEITAKINAAKKPAPVVDENPAPVVPTAPVVDEKPAPAIDDNPAPAIDELELVIEVADFIKSKIDFIKTGNIDAFVAELTEKFTLTDNLLAEIFKIINGIFNDDTPPENNPATPSNTPPAPPVTPVNDILPVDDTNNNATPDTLANGTLNTYDCRAVCDAVLSGGFPSIRQLLLDFVSIIELQRNSNYHKKRIDSAQKKFSKNKIGKVDLERILAQQTYCINSNVTRVEDLKRVIISFLPRAIEELPNFEKHFADKPHLIKTLRNAIQQAQDFSQSAPVIDAPPKLDLQRNNNQDTLAQVYENQVNIDSQFFVPSCCLPDAAQGDISDNALAASSSHLRAFTPPPVLIADAKKENYATQEEYNRTVTATPEFKVRQIASDILKICYALKKFIRDCYFFESRIATAAYKVLECESQRILAQKLLDCISAYKDSDQQRLDAVTSHLVRDVKFYVAECEELPHAKKYAAQDLTELDAAYKSLNVFLEKYPQIKKAILDDKNNVDSQLFDCKLIDAARAMLDFVPNDPLINEINRIRAELFGNEEPPKNNPATPSNTPPAPPVKPNNAPTTPANTNNIANDAAGVTNNSSANYTVDAPCWLSPFTNKLTSCGVVEYFDEILYNNPDAYIYAPEDIVNFANSLSVKTTADEFNNLIKQNHYLCSDFDGNIKDVSGTLFKVTNLANRLLFVYVMIRRHRFFLVKWNSCRDSEPVPDWINEEPNCNYIQNGVFVPEVYFKELDNFLTDTINDLKNFVPVIEKLIVGILNCPEYAEYPLHTCSKLIKYSPESKYKAAGKLCRALITANFIIDTIQKNPEKFFTGSRLVARPNTAETPAPSFDIEKHSDTSTAETPATFDAVEEYEGEIGGNEQFYPTPPELALKLFRLANSKKIPQDAEKRINELQAEIDRLREKIEFHKYAGGITYEERVRLLDRALKNFQNKEWALSDLKRRAYGVNYELKPPMLEPSAGTGDLIKACQDIFTSNNVMNSHDFEFDCIEIDSARAETLKSQSDIDASVIWDNFLTFQPLTPYHTIIMNPPFKAGVYHLLKAIDILGPNGQIFCILNAETIKNPYSRARQELIKQLENGAEYRVEFVQDAFKEYGVNVEVALIYYRKKPDNNSVTFDNFKKTVDDIYTAEGVNLSDDNAPKTSEKLTRYDAIQAMISRYRAEVKATLALYHEALNFNAAIKNAPLVDRNIFDIELKIEHFSRAGKEKRIIYYINKKYWAKLLYVKEFARFLSTDARQNYINKINDMADFEFNERNIAALKEDLVKSFNGVVDAAIMKIWQLFTYEYSMDNPENIHYYNGWKHNKAFKCNNKVIIPLASVHFAGFAYSYSYDDICHDVGIAMKYLDGGTNPYASPEHYFKINKYKKGTVHFTFKFPELLKKFNLYCGKRFNWLPDDYGKKPYNDLTPDEKAVADEFEGEDSYNDTYKNQNFYLTITPPKLPALNAPDNSN